MTTRPTTTWDGAPIAADPPFGAMVVAIRGDKVLVLRRAAALGDGDWAWTPPSGARRPGEDIESCAARELFEETGLSNLELRLVVDDDWHVFRVDVPGNVEIQLDDEHADYRWVSPREAITMCRPQIVADGLERAWRADQ